MAKIPPPRSTFVAKYPWRTMRVGAYFDYIGDPDVGRSLASRTSRKLTRKFVTRVQKDGGLRIWRES